MIDNCGFVVHVDATGGICMPRPKGKKPSVRLSVNLDLPDHDVLVRLAERHDVSIAWLVRKAVSEFVERHNRGNQGELVLPRGRLSDEDRPA